MLVEELVDSMVEEKCESSSVGISLVPRSTNDNFIGVIWVEEILFISESEGRKGKQWFFLFIMNHNHCIVGYLFENKKQKFFRIKHSFITF